MRTKWYAYGTHIGLISVSYIEKIDRQTKRIDKLMVIHSKKKPDIKIMVGDIIIFELFVLICCEGWGRIINMSSVVGLLSYPCTIGYCASKTGLFGLTKVWCVLFSWFKITDPWIRACLRISLLHLLLCSNLRERIQLSNFTPRKEND